MTSAASTGNCPTELSRISVTCAAPMAPRRAVPPNTTSSIFAPRRLLVDCSPSTQRIASEIFDFPLPFGPTIAVMPSENRMVVLSGNDLKPCNSSDFKYTQLPLIPHFTGTCRYKFYFIAYHVLPVNAMSAQKKKHGIVPCFCLYVVQDFYCATMCTAPNCSRSRRRFLFLCPIARDSSRGATAIVRSPVIWMCRRSLRYHSSPYASSPIAG